MKKGIILIAICVSLQLFGQNNSVPPQTIRDLRVIDSLFSKMNQPYTIHLDINYKTNKLKLIQYYKIDSISSEEDSLETTTELDSLIINQYCKRINTKFELIYPFLDLMIKNKFLLLYPAGPGDCKACCIAIYFKKNKAYVVTNPKHYCMDTYKDCFWGLWDEVKRDYIYKKNNIKKITEDILIVKI